MIEATKYPLTSNTWDLEEIAAIDKLLQSGQLTMGEKVFEFEHKAAKYFGCRYSVLVNSGSSANLLAVAALRFTQNNPLLPGDEVIVPAVSWATTYYPLHQYGLKLRFVDVDPNTMNLDPKQVVGAITRNTKAIFAVNLLGASCDYTAICDISRRYGLMLLEDNCESMGAQWEGKYCGTFGRMGTFSMHRLQISTIEGGLITTNEEELYHLLLALRSHGWKRHLPIKNQLENRNKNPFYDSFRFLVPGYNVRPTNLTGAVGTAQLRKLAIFLEGRRRNAEYFEEIMKDIEGVRIQQHNLGSAWFGFAVVLEKPHHSKRDEIVDFLLKNGIECRPIAAGNFVKNPVVKFFDYSVHGKLPAASEIDSRGFLIGNHHTDLRSEISHFGRSLKTILFPKRAL